MKMSVTTLGWPASPLETILADVQAAGGFAGLDFRGLGEELNITKLAAFNEGLDATMAAIQAAGLVVSGLSTSIKLVANAKGERAEAELVPYARLADRMGVRPLRLFAGQRRKDQSREAWMAEAVESLKRMTDATEGTQAELLIETHDDWCHSADVAELLDKVDHPRAAALWDVLITALMGGEAPADSARALGQRVRYTHVKDGHCDGGKFAIDMVGEGRVDLRGVVAALKSIGYDGWLTFEWEKRWHPDIPGAAEALPAFRRVIEPLM